MWEPRRITLKFHQVTSAKSTTRYENQSKCEREGNHFSCVQDLEFHLVCFRKLREGWGVTFILESLKRLSTGHSSAPSYTKTGPESYKSPWNFVHKAHFIEGWVTQNSLFQSQWLLFHIRIKWADDFILVLCKKVTLAPGLNRQVGELYTNQGLQTTRSTHPKVLPLAYRHWQSPLTSPGHQGSMAERVICSPSMQVTLLLGWSRMPRTQESYQSLPQHPDSLYLNLTVSSLVHQERRETKDCMSALTAENQGTLH